MYCADRLEMEMVVLPPEEDVAAVRGASTSMLRKSGRPGLPSSTPCIPPWMGVSWIFDAHTAARHKKVARQLRPSDRCSHVRPGPELPCEIDYRCLSPALHGIAPAAHATLSHPQHLHLSHDASCWTLKRPGAGMEMPVGYHVRA